jgi:hypothetical protein
MKLNQNLEILSKKREQKISKIKKNKKAWYFYIRFWEDYKWLRIFTLSMQISRKENVKLTKKKTNNFVIIKEN